MVEAGGGLLLVMCTWSRESQEEENESLCSPLIYMLIP